MEKLILFLIVFGVGSLYEYLKQLKMKRARNAASTSQNRRRPVMPIVSAPQVALRDDRHLLPDEGVRVTAETLNPIESLKDETGVRADESPITKALEPDPDLAAHYERWRRAIVDSEIIGRKFDL